jgi:hypothetical protein
VLERREELLVEARATERDEAIHRLLQLVAEHVDGRELAPLSQLAPQEHAGVADAAHRAIGCAQRASRGAAKRTPRVHAARRAQVVGPRAGLRERGDLVLGEQVGGDGAAAVATVERTAWPPPPRRASSARRHGGQRRREPLLALADLARQRALVVPCGLGVGFAEPPPQLDQLIGARRYLPDPDQKAFRCDEHPATLAPGARARAPVPGHASRAEVAALSFRREKVCDSPPPGRWAVCKADALSLDRKRFDKELAAAKIDPRDRLQSKLRFAALQKLVKEKAAALAADAAKDRGVEKVIETLPAAAAKQWADDSTAHKELLAWTYKVIDDARANNKRLMEGCESALQTHLASYLKGKSFTDDKELQHALRDHIGSQLGRAAALCFVRNEAAQKFWSNWSTGYARQMGPRTLTWYAIASEKIEFDTNRDLGMPRPLILYANASEGRSSGTIDKIEDAGDKVKISFSATAWTETVCKQWKETNRIESIDFNTGKLIYRQVCVKTAKEKRSSKAEPVTVDKAFAEGLRAGVAATFARSSDGAGYPIAIYASKDRAKIVGAFGVMF